MRTLSRFFKLLVLTFTERTKLWLIASLLLIAGIGWALEHVHVVEDGKSVSLIAGYSYYYDILLTVGFSIILASSLNLVNGHTGQFSLGHAGFMAVGAYVASIVSLGTQMPMLDYPSFVDMEWTSSGVAAKSFFAVLFKALGLVLTFALNSVLGVLNAAIGATAVFHPLLKFPAALIIGGLMAALTGLLVGVPSLRLRGDYLAIVTLGFNEIIRVVFQNCEPLGSQTGLRNIPPYTNFLWTFVWVAITIYVIYNLVNSTYGRGFLAVRDDEIAAEAMGINTTRYKVLAFVIAAFFAGVAGGLYAHFRQFINADGFNFIRSFDFVVMVIIGGMGSIRGVAVAAALLTILPEVLRKLGQSEWVASVTKRFTTDMPAEQQEYVLRRVQEFFGNRMIFFSVILIIVMIMRPQGLFGVGAIKKGGTK
jgi:branched-chain amino acid transport system permease protein